MRTVLISLRTTFLFFLTLFSKPSLIYQISQFNRGINYTYWGSWVHLEKGGEDLSLRLKI